MSNSMAINGYGNPYAQNAQYYQYPYMQTYATLQNNQGGYQTSVAQNPPITAKPEKKSHAAGWILGTVAVAGAAILCHKKGNADLKFFPRLWDGAKNCKDIALNWCKKAAKKLSSVKTQKVSELKGELPQITKLTEDGKTVLNDNVALRDYIANIKEKGAEIQVKNGKLSKLTFLGEDWTQLYNTDKAIKAEIDGVMSGIQKGQHLDALKEIRFTQKADGIKQLFKAENITATPEFIVGVKKA